MVSPNPALSTTQEPQAGLLAMPPWQHEKAVTLLPHVRRLTAPNPGLMTGPGTNSYLVGEAATGWLVIDPGPDEPAHVERLWDAAGGDIRLIVCTHSHADHAPAARPLQALCARRGGRTPPLLGLPSAPTANPASHFVPDRPLADGERLLLQAADGTVRHILQVIHTPGHAANHLCLLLPGNGNGDGLLFSGDHVLNGSTTVINPPDGNMTAYLDALDALDAVCTALDLGYILPAHGHVMNDAQAVIAKLKAHRLAREAKVRVAMQARPQGTLDDWVELAYDDVPQSIWPLAKRSLLAHVERLRALPGGAP